ncbi:toxin MazF [Candidatus Arcanobacter lacustris]|uniref:Toxin MazF n=1 Tax=Candidatus Arcanibacter lacustris TaxID=1607817 RepID=A0A0F5MMU3_9RICK|nr:toxin MazF [Candidatus Arcanobacter lacustris]
MILNYTHKGKGVKFAFGTCMPITSKIKNYPFEVNITSDKVTGAILSDSLRSIDWKARKASFIVKCDDLIFSQAISKLKILIE